MYHSLTIVGNVGKEPEMRYTPSGQAVTSFSVASNREYTANNGEKAKETVWFRVSVWGKLAEICNQYVKKGMLILVEGRLTPDKSTGSPRVYETKGGHGASYEVTAQNIRFLSKSDSKENETPFDDRPSEGEGWDGDVQD